MPRLLIAVLAASLLVACVSKSDLPDTGSSILQDSGINDVGHDDAGFVDVGAADTGLMDIGHADVGLGDVGPGDVGSDIGHDVGGLPACRFEYPANMDFTAAGTVDSDGKNIFMSAERAVWYEGSVTQFDGVGISLALHAGRGVFAESIHSGIFSLEGAELNPETCGFCLEVSGSHPVSGTVRIDLDDGWLAVKLINAVVERTNAAYVDAPCRSLMPTTIVEGGLRTTCDLESGVASQCDAGTRCISAHGAVDTCLPSCSPLAPNACALGEGCYMVSSAESDPSQPYVQAFACLPAGWVRYDIGVRCDNVDGRCLPGSECLLDGKCHKYCDTSSVAPRCANGIDCVSLGIGANIGVCGHW